MDKLRKTYPQYEFNKSGVNGIAYRLKGSKGTWCLITDEMLQKVGK